MYCSLQPSPSWSELLQPGISSKALENFADVQAMPREFRSTPRAGRSQATVARPPCAASSRTRHIAPSERLKSSRLRRRASDQMVVSNRIITVLIAALLCSRIRDRMSIVPRSSSTISTLLAALHVFIDGRTYGGLLCLVPSEIFARPRLRLRPNASFVAIHSSLQDHTLFYTK